MRVLLIPQATRLSRGFTLIELLTVVAIIALLIGILVPAVNKARDTAKRASSQNLLAVLGKGCENFHAELDRYPKSSGGNPFEADPNSVPLSGAQWLILELAGADLKGYVARDKYRYYDYDGDGDVDYADWQKYYTNEPNAVQLHRFGPYVPLDGKVAQSPDYYRKNTSLTRAPLPELLDPSESAAGTSNWNNGRLAFAVDAFGMPVLYYAANDQALHPFTDPVAPDGGYGRYTQWDNKHMTGSDWDATPGWDLGGGATHALGVRGWESAQPNIVDHASFAGVVYDQALYEQTGGTGVGKVWPRRPDTFLLIAPGKDGVYGNADDVTNF